MSDGQGLNAVEVRAVDARASVSAAKAGLLQWAQEHDARSRQSWSRRRTLAAAGAIAALGGITVVRVLRPRVRSGAPTSRVKRVGRSLINWALVARTARWLLPYAIRAVRDNRNGRIQKVGTPVATYGPA